MNGANKHANVTNKPILHGHADAARSSAYAAYESPAASPGNSKLIEVTFFAALRTASGGSFAIDPKGIVQFQYEFI